MGWGHQDWGYMGLGHTGSAGVVVMLLLFVLLVVVTTVAILAVVGAPGWGRGTGGTRGDTPPPASAAEAELELRYARGEIDAETLARQRAVLRQR